MSNGEVCCILGVCCPPEGARAALITELRKVMVGTHGVTEQGPAAANLPMPYVEACADYVLATFDLAPKGSISGLVEYVKAHAGHTHTLGESTESAGG